MIHLILNQDKHYDTDGEELLSHLLSRLTIGPNIYVVDYCYTKTPPKKAKERAETMLQRRAELEDFWLANPCSIVAFGKFACEVVFGKGQPKNRVGTRWTIASDKVLRKAWYTYDPAAALFDANLCVDICGVLYNAATEAGHNPRSNPQATKFNWLKYI